MVENNDSTKVAVITNQAPRNTETLQVDSQIKTEA